MVRVFKQTEEERMNEWMKLDVIDPPFREGFRWCEGHRHQKCRGTWRSTHSLRSESDRSSPPQAWGDQTQKTCPYIPTLEQRPPNPAIQAWCEVSPWAVANSLLCLSPISPQWSGATQKKPLSLSLSLSVCVSQIGAALCSWQLWLWRSDVSVSVSVVE